MSVGRRVRARENTRREILDAARELFVKEDYPAISIRRIAEKIEYSPSAIYFYFKDKEEILLELVKEGYRLMGERVFPETGTGDPLESLRKSSRAYLAFAREEPHYYRIMFQVACDAPTPTVGMVGVELFEALMQKIEEAFLRQGRGSQGDVRATAASLWASLHGLATLKITGMVMIEPYEETEDRLLAIVFAGLSV